MRSVLYVTATRLRLVFVHLIYNTTVHAIISYIQITCMNLHEAQRHIISSSYYHITENEMYIVGYLYMSFIHTLAISNFNLDAIHKRNGVIFMFN
jgi:hypothetical protein